MSAKLKKTLLLLPCMVLVLAVASRGHIGNAIAGASAQASGDAGLGARISRIENGLLPAVVIKGSPPKPMTISERMAFYKVPGVSVAFFEHGQIVWTRGYGYADVATKKPITPDTLFQAASISKPVAALAALRLVQDGKLSLDEDVNVKLKTWKVPDNAFTVKEKVTVRRIVSHSAGLTVHGFPGYASDEKLPSVVQILNGEKPANTEAIRVDVVPGTLWRYSGGGYVILQTLMSDVTGEAFPKIMHDLVLQPAGMTHSTYEQPLPKGRLPEVALPYRANGEPVKGGPHTYPEMAPAGLWTTPSDLARVAMEVQKEYAGQSSKILNPSMAKQMLTRQIGNWGLGFGLENQGQTAHFGHGGANEGYRCELEAYTDSGEGVAIMTNSDSGGDLYSELLRSIAKEYNWPDFHPIEHTLLKVNPETFQSYVGTYEIQGLGKLTVTLNANQLYIQAEPLGAEPIALFPESETNFFVLNSDLTFSFGKQGANGPINSLTVHAGPQTFEAKKVS
jgi:CubicO group peptidase (beta-lactamase class C family)